MAKDTAAPFVLAGQQILPGTRKRLELPGPTLVTHTPVNLSVEVVHGNKPGPVLLVCAAVHGDELNGIEIIRRLGTLPSLSSLAGTLVLVPIVNVHGFLHRSRYLPDRRDLNRCFPGSRKGSLGSRMAHLFFSEVVRHCTHIIDLHTAAVHRDNLPQLRAALDEPGVSELAQGFGVPVVVNAKLIDDSLRCEASKLNIPTVTFEAGEALRLSEPAIVTGVRGITNVLTSLSMLPPTDSAKPRIKPSVAASSRWYRATSDGLFRSLVSMGSRVARGDALGVIAGPTNSAEDVVRATQEGILVGLNKLPLVNAGDALFHVAEFAEPVRIAADLTTYAQDIEADPLFALGPSTGSIDLA